MGAKLNDFLPFISEDTAKLVLTLFRIVAIFGLGYWLWDAVKKQTSTLLNWALALIFAGALGNINNIIVCQDLQAELISIAGNYSISEQIDNKYWQQPSIISYDRNSLNIKLIKS